MGKCDPEPRVHDLQLFSVSGRLPVWSCGPPALMVCPRWWEKVVLEIRGYCSISFNSAGPMTRYRPAENLVSALSEFGRDKARNSAVQRRRPQNFTILRL